MREKFASKQTVHKWIVYCLVLFVQELPTQVEVRRAGDDEKGIGDNVIQQLLELSEQVPGTGHDGQGLSEQDADIRDAVQAAELHDQVNHCCSYNIIS